MEHARLAVEFKGKRGIIEMRKHLGWYLQQVPGTKELRQKVFKAIGLEEVAELLGRAG